MTPYTLVITFPTGSADGEAKGKLFVDDDERPEMKMGDGRATYIKFYAKVIQNTVKVWSEVQEGEFALSKGWTIEKVTVLGLEGHGQGLAIVVGGMPVVESGATFNHNELRHVDKLEGDNQKKGMMVEIGGLELPLGKNFAMTWKMGIKG